MWLGLISLWPLNTLDQIGRNNLARKQAEKAFQQSDFQQAATRFAYLTKNSAKTDATVWLNLGHAFFLLKNYNEAKKAYAAYAPLATGASVGVAYTQLGVIACADRDSSQALDLFRKALLTNPENEPARYNYELLKQRFSGRDPSKRKPKQIPKPRQTPQQSKQEVARSARQVQVLRRLQTMNMTEEQANQLLNSMREDDLPLELARRRSVGEQSSKNTRYW